MENLLDKLSALLGSENVLLGENISKRYWGDWSGFDAQSPIAVVRPGSTGDVSFILKSCFKVGQPVVVQGGLTGLCAGATPQLGEIAISLERMSGVEEIDAQSRTMTVLAGTPLQTVQEKAKAAGFRFPLDLGARGSCTIGGNISTNAGGNQVLRFGMARALVLGLEVVLPNGTILTSLNKMLKNNAGFDLKHLFIGTEGTLGIVTKAVLRLYPEPKSCATAFCALNSVQDTIQLLHFLSQRLGNGLSAFEVMWSDYLDYTLKHVSDIRSPFDKRFENYVLTEFEGVQPDADLALFQDVLNDAIESGIVSDAIIAKSEKEVGSLWRIRDAIGDVFTQLTHAISFDISAPLGVIPQMLALISQDLHDCFADFTKLTYGHLGDSNIHLTITTGIVDDLAKISEIVYRRTGDCNGSISGEHGIGVTKLKYLNLSRTDCEIQLMRQLKSLIDPTGILNPGRVIP